MADKKHSDNDWLQIRAKKCSVKKAFKSQVDAIIFASEFIRKRHSDVVGFRVNQCDFCKSWHLTKQI